MKKRMYKLLALGMALSMNLSMVQPVMAFNDSNLSAGECEHNEVYLQPSSQDETKHYVICSSCNEVIAEEDHSYDEESLCVCGAECHAWAFEEEWNDDDSHYAYCLICGDEHLYTHIYENGICLECSHICQHSDFDEFDNCLYCGLTVEKPTCEHGDDKYKLWRYADTDKHILVCECGETVEEGNHNQNACDPIYTQDPKTNEFISTQHIFHCDVCYGEKTEGYEDHMIAEGDFRCSKCGYVDESKLASIRNDAKQQLDNLADTYKTGIYGSAMEEVINSAKNDIDTYYDKDSMYSRVKDAEEAMPAALLSDTKTDACQKMDQEINKKQRSDEFYETVQEWVNLIQAAEDIDAVQEALTDILENKIPAAEAAHPYVEPLATVYRAIAGSYGDGDVTVCKDEDGSLILLYKGDIMPVNEAYLLEDGTIEVIAGNVFDFSDNSVSVYRRGRLLGTYDKTGNAAPDNTIPTCPTCHEPMILESTNAEGCTWICDANGCVVSAIGHAPAEICVCGTTHIHTFDENGRCTVDGCDYVSPTRELAAKKAEFEAYKERAVAAAGKKATAEDSADVTQLIKNAQAAIEAVEFDKNDIEAQKTAIEDILTDLDADIAAQKEAEKQPEVLCKSEKVISPKSGFYGLYLNGTYAGDFTFESVTGGWAIQDSQGYLTVENGVLTHTNVPAAWGYKNGSFFQTAQTTNKGFFGWLFNTKTTTYYYLTSPTSVSTKTVKTEIRETVLAGSHTFTDYVDLKDGTHKRTCTVCGGVETEACVYDEETGYCICGAFDPARVQVTIKANVTKETQKYLLFFTKTTYRATITTQAEGTTVKKVEYSTNGGKTWTKGSSFTSSSAIGSFLVRATDAQGNVYTYTYPEEVIDR